jgi:hypothetical protein
MLKTVSSVANALGALNYQGTWNASTNTPTLASGVGTQGDYYVVSVAGSTNLDGITNWGVGDWAAFNGSVWQRVEGGSDGNFVDLTVTGEATVGNINSTSNTISTTDTNGDLVLAPNGTGLVQVKNATAPTIELRNTKAWNSPESGTFASIKGYTTDASGTGARVVAEIELNNNAASAVPGGDWVFKTSEGGGTPTLYERVRIGGGGNLTLASGNNVVFASGNGIDFSATAGSGTSELFDDYEEGVWTPIDSSGAGLTFAASSGSYTKVGRMVMATGFVNFPVTADGSNNKIGGLPFTNIDSTSRGVGAVNYKQVAALDTLMPENNATTLFFATATGSVTTNAQISNTAVYFGLVYTAS